MKKLLSGQKFKIFLILLIVSILSALWLILGTKGGPNPTPTPVPRIFGLDKIIPSDGLNTTIVPTSAIEFDFNKQINPNTVIVNVNPASNVKFETSDNQRSVFVRVIPTWNLNTNYTISVDVKSAEGESLPNKIDYPLLIVQQTKSNLIEKFQ